jgi:NAD(P)-dependent dehydrogenase (short-subunit alcohol dehydrogenase family)
VGALDGRVAIVTGGASGIGRATAQALADAGASVVVADLDSERAGAVAAEVGGVAVGADVGEPGDWERIVASATAAFGGVDLAHLNAGVTTGESDIRAVTDAAYRRIMRANVDGVVFGTRAVVPAMQARGGGAIVATASLAGLIAFAPDPIYTLTKHAVVGFVRAVAPQLEPLGITINAVCPGMVDTPMVGPEAKAVLESAGFPLIPPADIAAAVLAAMSGGATGQAYVCQAGRPPVPYAFRGVPGPAGHQRPPRGMGDPAAEAG